MKALSLVILLTGVPLFLGFSQLPCQWAPGMYWEWSTAIPQSPSWGGTTSVYVLKAEMWGDYETDLLAWISPFKGGKLVKLGVVVRQPCSSMRGFGFWYSDIYRWVFYPPGSTIELHWRAEGSGESAIQVELSEERVAVEVPAGVFPECVKLTRYSHVANEFGTMEGEETIWFDEFLGWPVKAEYVVYYKDRVYTGQTELLSYGKLTVEEAVSQVLAALEEMEVLNESLAQEAQHIRDQLESLGLFSEGQ